MPSHGLIPYKVGLREKGDTDNYWDLTDLHQHDNTLPEGSLIDLLDEFFGDYDGNLDANSSEERTFVVEGYNVYPSDRLVEGVVATGDYGYESELRDVNTGQLTYRKDEDESELFPYYFLLWIPETQAGQLYESGQRAIMVFQQINGRSFKTAFAGRFDKEYIRSADNTVFEITPVTSEKVLDKVINSQRVLSAEFQLDKIPNSDEGKMQLMEGMNTAENKRNSYVMKADRGGSIDRMKHIAQNLKGINTAGFAQIVSDPVDDLKVTIKNDQGRDETFSLLDDELSMKKELNPSGHNLDAGLPKNRYLSKEMSSLINEILPQGQVKTLNHRTQM